MAVTDNGKFYPLFGEGVLFNKADAMLQSLKTDFQLQKEVTPLKRNFIFFYE